MQTITVILAKHLSVSLRNVNKCALNIKDFENSAVYHVTEWN